MKKLSPGKCHVRRASDLDYPELERIYVAHEGKSIPVGYFSEFKETIRDPEVHYFVAEVDGKLVGGGGVSEYIPNDYAHLVFGLVDPEECGKGYGTSILLSRLLYTGTGGCQIALQVTEWSGEFFARIGFLWHGQEEDEYGNRFLYGSLIIHRKHNEVFKGILNTAGITTEFS